MSEVQELSEEKKKEITNKKLVNAFEMNLTIFQSLTINMTKRQLGRVLRSLMAAPFLDHEKFQDPKEKALFDAGMQIMDAKVLLIMEHQSEIEKALKETQDEALKQEKKENK